MTGNCVVCKKEVPFQSEENLLKAGWIPIVYFDGEDKGPVCPDHEIDYSGEELTLRR